MNHLLTQPEYLIVIAEMGKKAVAIADSESFIQSNIVKEIRSQYIQCKNADCTYNAYVAANCAEGWFQKLEDFINGTIKSL